MLGNMPKMKYRIPKKWINVEWESFPMWWCCKSREIIIPDLSLLAPDNSSSEPSHWAKWCLLVAGHCCWPLFSGSWTTPREQRAQLKVGVNLRSSVTASFLSLLSTSHHALRWWLPICGVLSPLGLGMPLVFWALHSDPSSHIPSCCTEPAAPAFPTCGHP